MGQYCHYSIIILYIYTEKVFIFNTALYKLNNILQPVSRKEFAQLIVYRGMDKYRVTIRYAVSFQGYEWLRWITRVDLTFFNTDN